MEESLELSMIVDSMNTNDQEEAAAVISDQGLGPSESRAVERSHLIGWRVRPTDLLKDQRLLIGKACRGCQWCCLSSLVRCAEQGSSLHLPGALHTCFLSDAVRIFVYTMSLAE